MTNLIAIARRELGAYFNSPVAYIVITLYLGISGFMFFDNLFIANQADMRSFFAAAPLMFAFFVPAITMRLLAEERRTGTIELLITLPIRDVEVVLGKFVAALGLFALMILLTAPFAISVAQNGPLDKGPVLGGYLGLLMLGGAYLAIGLMASSWTKNQIIALIITSAICLILWLIDAKVELVPPAVATVLQGLSPAYHFRNVARGVIDARDVIYFLTLIAGCLTIAVRSLESRQWR